MADKTQIFEIDKKDWTFITDKASVISGGGSFYWFETDSNQNKPTKNIGHLVTKTDQLSTMTGKFIWCRAVYWNVKLIVTEV